MGIERDDKTGKGSIRKDGEEIEVEDGDILFAIAKDDAGYFPQIVCIIEDKHGELGQVELSADIRADKMEHAKQLMLRIASLLGYELGLSEHLN